MPVFYVVKQDRRKNGTRLFYGKAVHPSTVSFDDICERVQANTTAKKADVLCVLTEYIEQMKFYMQQGYKVEWDGIGSFYISGKSAPVTELKDVKGSDMKDPKLRFIASWNRDTEGNVTRAFTEDITYQKAQG